SLNEMLAEFRREINAAIKEAGGRKHGEYSRSTPEWRPAGNRAGTWGLVDAGRLVGICRSSGPPPAKVRHGDDPTGTRLQRIGAKGHRVESRNAYDISTRSIT